ncbi:hypothetical protein CPB83DRAFT_900897 [Crepidotus variabilis]|uniref:RING-type domain-containing protein n=1 Tax=Crepidotus variabilis TaxID=179855 RepID=A0A9P6BC25_9AGAR|nr:hypothetical protein CPB83DRAFT_900897 [Crepidotus variabilis]
MTGSTESSDSDVEVSVVSAATIIQLQKQIQLLKHESRDSTRTMVALRGEFALRTEQLDAKQAELDHVIKEALAEISSLRIQHDKQMEQAVAQISSLENKLILAGQQLIESLECGICANEIQNPATLRDCGHTFCRNCLMEWFSKAQDKFMAANPGYDPLERFENLTVSQAYATIHELVISNGVRDIKLKNALPLSNYPPYECPFCRTLARSSPLCVFALDALHHQVITMAGLPVKQENGNHEDHNVSWNKFFVK